MRDQPPREVRGSTPQQLQLRGTAEWENWLKATAEAHRRSRAGLIHEALIEFAEAHGHRPPPPRLIGVNDTVTPGQPGTTQL